MMWEFLFSAVEFGVAVLVILDVSSMEVCCNTSKTDHNPISPSITPLCTILLNNFFESCYTKPVNSATLIDNPSSTWIILVKRKGVFTTNKAMLLEVELG